jgi:hypothetical protein
MEETEIVRAQTFCRSLHFVANDWLSPAHTQIMHGLEQVFKQAHAEARDKIIR